jgi:predicted nucleic acid-binding protein
MILVDTTVWIDFFGGFSPPHVRRMESAIAAGEDLCTCGLILAEVLQGIRDEMEYTRTRARLEPLLYLPMSRDTFLAAADHYRSLRRRGITIRKPVDCMIAAVAIEHRVPLLHNDRDFDHLEKHAGLRVARSPA